MYIIVNKVIYISNQRKSSNCGWQMRPTSASTCVFHAVRIWNPKERDDMGDAWRLRIPVVLGPYVR